MFRSTITMLFATIILVGCAEKQSPPEVVEPVEPPAVDIWKASGEGAVDIVQQHIDAGTDLNGTFYLEGVAGSGGTPLHIALLADQQEITTLLIDNEADVNRKAIPPDPFGGTPLHWAVVVENISGVRALIDAGANVNSTDDYGTRPLDAALLDMTTFQPMEYASLSVSKKAIYDLLYENGARHQ